MKLDIVALVIGLLGIVVSMATFFAFYRVEKRKRRAEARKLEIEGDLGSLEYFTNTINELKKDNEDIKKKFKELKIRFEELEKKLGAKEWIISLYEKAGKYCHSCGFIPEGKKCPAIEEYENLTK